MASVVAKPCDNCEHVEVCAYRSSYERIISEVQSTIVTPPGALAKCELVDVDFISSVFINCKYFCHHVTKRSEIQN
jgi:hypothetical protein